MEPKTKRLIILISSLALVLGFAAAELQRNVRSVVSSGSLKGFPDVAYDARAERYLIVWQERAGAGDDRDIRARVLNRDGSPASAVVALASSGEDERSPKTAATGSSSWTVVWSTGGSIEACSVDATGKADNFRAVTAGPSRPVDRPDIGACSSDGASLVVWEEIDETGITVIKGRHIRSAPAGATGEEFLIARSFAHDLGHPTVNQSGGGSFVAWDKAVEARRSDVEGRAVPASAASIEDFGEIVVIAGDGAQNTLPSVTAFAGTDAFLVVWQRSDGRRGSDIAFANVTGGEVQAVGKLTETADLWETRPSASSVGIAGRAIVTYQTASSNKLLLREIVARTIGWGDLAPSAEIALDPSREGGGNPAAVPAAGADGRGLVVWDVKEGEGTDLYSKEWLASELGGNALSLALDGPIVLLADVNISGVATFNGMAQAGVLLSGFPVETRTDATGAYTAAVPTGWSGTVIPVQPGFTFDPASRTYASVAADITGENYTAAYAGGAEDIYEDNDSFAAAAELPLGTTHDLVLNDEDWFKFYVPSAEAGKDLKVRLWGTAFPNTTVRRDLDFGILDASGRLLSFSLSGSPDETAFVCGVAEGWYYIAHNYVGLAGTVYSLTVELSDAFGLGYVEGHVYDDYGMPIEGATVELYGALFDWNVTRPMAITDASGYYMIGWVPGDFTVRFNVSDFGNDNLAWTPDANYLGEMYNWGQVVTVSTGATLSDIDGELTPGGIISGRITDSLGTPFTYARINLNSGDLTGAGSGSTDDTGNYSFDRVRAGNFAVQLLTPNGNPLIVNEWYDDHADFASADPVGIAPGITTAGVDGQLQERLWGAIQGHVTDVYDNPVGNMIVAIIDPAAGFGPWTVRTDPSGYYIHSRVPAGSWKVFFNAGNISSSTPPNLVPQYYPGTRFLSEATTVPVAAGQTTEGVDAVLESAGTITGQVLNNNGNVSVIAIETTGDFSRSVSPGIPLTGPPTYTMRNLRPGTYKIMARPSQQGDRIAQWHPAADSYTDAGTVTVTSGETTSGVDVTLASGGGSISGRVLDADGYPVAGVPVIVQDASKRINVSSWPSDVDGYFTVRQVPPGPAKVFFNTDGNWLNYSAEYYNNKADHTTANAVTVTEGETTTLADAVLAYRPAMTPVTASLPDGEVAVPYSQQLEATGGRPFYRWSISWGALPDGLTMGSNGLITGTPTTVGTSAFGVVVSDSTLPQQSEPQFLSITVGTYSGAGYTISGTVTEFGSPVAGVVLDGLPGGPVTSSSGTYIAVVDPAWWDTVTPVLAGYAFDPPLRTYAVVTENLSGQDYSATPGYRLSGAITVGGVPLSGVRITGIPTEIRTDEHGTYSIMLPTGWGGTVTPVLTGFTFTPPYMDYAPLLADTPGQDYVATFAGGADDAYENNDTFATAAEVAMGTVVQDLVLLDEDWFKFYVPPGDAGKVVGIRLFATSFPNGAAYSDPARGKDLDYGVMDATGRLLTYSMSGSVDEVTFIPDIQPGWYYIGHTYMINPGMVYSLYVDTSDVFPVGTISGRITDPSDQGIDGVTVELFRLPFDWNESFPMAITDADGNYKIAAFAGNFQVKVNLRDFDQNPTDGLPDGWLPVRNYLPNSYDYDRTVSLAAAAPVTGADVVLPPAGAVSGRVTDGAGNPLYQARVHAYLAGAIQASMAFTDADGNYSLRHLRSANYAFQFRPPSGSSLAREWYDDRTTLAESPPVAVTAGATTAGIDAVLEVGGQISGHMTNEAEDPVPGVTVVAFDPSGVSMQSTTTQADGSYLLNSLRGGSFDMLFNPSSCNAGNYLIRGYGSGEPVTVALGQTTTGIDAVLHPAGAIAGRLTDQDSHGLLSGSVQAINNATGDSWGATLDFEGNYLIRNLLPGDYRVRFAYAFGSITNFPPEWYPNVDSGAEATLVPVAAGDTVSGIDGVLEADGGGFSGRVTNSSGTGIPGLAVEAIDGSFGGFNTGMAITDANGNYTALNVPLGTAKVRFQPGAMNFVQEFFNDKTSLGTADAVPIAPGYVQPGIDAMLADGPALAVTTTSLPAGELGVAYDQQLARTGGMAFFHWTITAGGLPPGLTMNVNGEISGMPTMEGTFAFTIQLADSGIPQQVLTQGLSITIGEYTGLGYTISGTATAEGTPLAGVTLNGLPGSPVTNAAGGYVAVVPSGWGGTVTPALSGYAFDPTVRTYANVAADISGEDYAASPGYLISGTVTFDGTGLAGVRIAGLPGEPWTDAAGGYAMMVTAGWGGTVTPTLPGFTFAPADRTYTATAADATGQDYVATFEGGVDDAFEDNDDFAGAAEVPLGTTTGLVLNDEDWFKVYVPAGDAGKDLRVHIWGTAYPDTTTRRDLDFYVLSADGTALSLNLSGSPDETAYICDVAEGWYYIGHTYVGLEGTVYSLSVDANDDFGLGYIAGTVRDDDGNPVPAVAVELYGQPFNWDISRPLVFTDASGQFRIGYAPGLYTVQFNVNVQTDGLDWTPDANVIPEVYNGGEVLTVAAGTTLAGIDGQLTVGGIISGRITDESGVPLGSAIAYAHAGDTVRAGFCYTDGNGDYTIKRLRTGNYAVRLRALGPFGLAMEWFEDQGVFAAAIPVAVVEGETTSGINAALGTMGGIAGHVENETGDPLAGVQVTACDPVGIALQAATTDGSGNYMLGRLPTGAFKVLFNAATAWTGNFVSEYYPDQRFIADAGTVDVAAGSTTPGIDAVLADAGTITGRVTDAGGNAHSGIGVTAFDVDSDFYLSATTGADGSYTIVNLPPGTYKVRFRPTSGDWAVEWWGDKTNFTEADVVPVAAGVIVSGIDAEISEECGWITGRVTDGLGAGIAGLTVVAQDTARAAAYNTAVTDGDGNYALNRLPTCLTKIWFNADGAYLGYASEYYNDKADHSAADAVSVTVGETTANIDAMLAARPALTVATDALPAGELAVEYSASLAASGGRTLYHWSLGSGALPDGLAMNARGEIAGTPTMAGVFAFTVRLTDSTRPQQITTKELSITVGAYTGLGHTISGQILFGGLPLASVTLNGLPGTPTTNSAGGYVAVVPDGWSGVTAPALAGYAFVPAKMTYAAVTASLDGQDYEAFVGRTISGTVTLESVGLAGVLMSGLPGDPLTAPDGTYSGVVPDGWSGTVTPTLDGYTFSPVSVTYSSVITDQADQNYTAAAAHKSKEDFVGTWTGQGVYYRNSDTGAWVKMATPATMIATGDLDGDGVDDLIGLWPTQGGIWIKYSSNGVWAKLSSTAVHIAAGDMNGDGREDLLGTWDGQGVYYRNSMNGAWVKLASPATLITTGDVDGDGTDDLVGIWPTQGGVWVKYSSTGAWAKLSSTARDISAGDANGDGRDDLIATWDGQGVFYRDSMTGAWIKMASVATQVTCGDLDADGKSDLIGIWPTQGGVWVKYSETGAWALLSSTAVDLAAGIMRAQGGAGEAAAVGLAAPAGGLAAGPEGAFDVRDLSDEGPGGRRFVPEEGRDLTPREQSEKKMGSKIPGPGERGFNFKSEKNLSPRRAKVKRSADKR